MEHRKPAIALIAMIVSMTFSQSALAKEAKLQVPSLYIQVARSAGIPAKVLYNLAITESKTTLSNGRVRPWPWTLNVKGVGYHYKSEIAACRALNQHLTRTTLIDIGLTQLNWRYQKQHFKQPCDALAPKANLQLAAKLLIEGMSQHGNWVAAAGYFHRPAGGALAAKYQRHFISNYQRY